MTADDPRPAPPPPLHPDLDTLADYDAGVLDESTAERVGTHVRSCAECTAAIRAMAAVQEDLRALPSPPMPAAVAARLDGVLADLRRGDQPGERDGTPPVRLAPPAPRRFAPPPPVEQPGPAARVADDLAAARQFRRQRRSRLLSAAAAAVVVLAAVGGTTAVIRASTSGGSDSDVTSAAGGGADNAEKLPAAPSVADSGGVPSYSRESLRSAIPQIERQSPVDIITGLGDTGPAGAMSDTARRTACAGTIRGTRGELQAVRRIRYEGAMAYVFVFAEDGRRTAYVVSDECGTSPALPAAVLDTVS